jgi:prepilin-type N-terminal cleavage/methylation domain-containing protein
MKRNSSTPGFTLIEISVVIAVASMLILFAYNLFQYTVRVTSRTQTQIDVTMTVPIITHLFKNDMSSAFVPHAGWPKKDEKKEQESSNSNQEQSSEQASAKKAPPIEQVFRAEESDENLQYITFISTNSLAVHESAQPRVVRLVYSVAPDEDGMYALYRQESFDLYASLDDLQQKKEERYMIVRGIKRIRTRFLVPKIEKEDKQQESNQKQQQEEEIKPPEYLTFNTWATEQVKEQTEALVPEYVELEFTVFDAVHNQTFDIEITSPVQAYAAIEEQRQQQEVKKQQAKKQEAQKKQQGQQQAQQNQTQLAMQPGSLKNNLFAKG